MRAHLGSSHEVDQAGEDEDLDDLLDVHPGRVRRELDDDEPDDAQDPEQDDPPVRPPPAAGQGRYQEHVDDADHDVSDDPSDDSGGVAVAERGSLLRIGDVPMVELVADDAAAGEDGDDRQHDRQVRLISSRTTTGRSSRGASFQPDSGGSGGGAGGGGAGG